MIAIFSWFLAIFNRPFFCSSIQFEFTYIYIYTPLSSSSFFFFLFFTVGLLLYVSWFTVFFFFWANSVTTTLPAKYFSLLWTSAQWTCLRAQCLSLFLFFVLLLSSFFYFWREGLITAEHRTVRSWRVFDFCCSLFVCFFVCFLKLFQSAFFLSCSSNLSRVSLLIFYWTTGEAIEFGVRCNFLFFFSFLTTYLFFWIWFVDIFSFLFLDFCFQPRFFWSFY